MKHLVTGSLLAVVLAATGCNRSEPSRADADGGHGVSFVDGKIVLKSEGLPSATITEQGELLIGGKPVQLTDAQRRLTLEYRTQLQAITRQGIEVGKQGAALGVQAAGEALKGVFSGNTDKIGEKVEAEAEKIKQQALKICDHLDSLKQAQDALAGQVPAFRPYAALDAHSVSDCRDD
ncbi:MAG TPA: DUF2884 domain-containing protein [Xanthomonadaceae bacterium]|nr:DUF2884 domain-containing protein [Xanthomonadaceae bacterium]